MPWVVFCFWLARWSSDAWPKVSYFHKALRDHSYIYCLDCAYLPFLHAYMSFWKYKIWYGLFWNQILRLWAAWTCQTDSPCDHPSPILLYFPSEFLEMPHFPNAQPRNRRHDQGKDKGHDCLLVFLVPGKCILSIWRNFNVLKKPEPVLQWKHIRVVKK